ncbi:MAG TPA: N(4)-(beta-N-acetylglucosaminyl)-L-asparaginase [Candidatus Acidoferrales bacterium]|jgi:N4-(beta-N-acetylglucosaminyl)-L-asparaginase|nr:N(4)-(beta-N-acetylglucosaminyl)-L-asparaginase [Candidatus Acidoferrales bacterium]
MNKNNLKEDRKVLRGTPMNVWTRRKFFLTTLAGGFAASVQKLFGATIAGKNGHGRLADPLDPMPLAPQAAAKGTRPLIISASNGFRHLDKGMDILKNGGDTLDAVLAVVTEVENDPNDHSVGLGGLPNEEGEVELDAQVMHGPTRRGGAVGAIRRIQNPSLVAKRVMEHTDHIMIVGDGAMRFAVAQGFDLKDDLLTAFTRQAWLTWKAKSSVNWAPGIDSPDWKGQVAALFDTPEKMAMKEAVLQVVEHPPTGTINCLAVDKNGDISGTTTTSGLAWKIPGRVGDSPIIGAGNYVDNDVGAAGSTGLGEENIRICGAHTIVEMMRKGISPTDACLEALGRVVRNFNKDMTRLSLVDLNFYALNKDGVHGGATLWGPPPGTNRAATYAMHDGTQPQHVTLRPLLERKS